MTIVDAVNKVKNSLRFKLDKNLGVSETGKTLIIDNNGDIVTTDINKVYEGIIGTDGATVNEIFTNKLPDGGYQTNDIFIIKTLIADNKYSHSAYIFDATINNWRAMDGDYNAENIYFDENIIVTETVGNIELTNGEESKTIQIPLNTIAEKPIEIYSSSLVITGISLSIPEDVDVKCVLHSILLAI